MVPGVGLRRHQEFEFVLLAGIPVIACFAFGRWMRKPLQIEPAESGSRHRGIARNRLRSAALCAVRESPRQAAHYRIFLQYEL